MPSATHSESTTPFLDIIETNLFVDADSLLANITAATKGPDGLLDWIELKPKLHGSLVKCATRLVSRHTTTFNIASAKEALFTFLINLLNGTSCTPFLEKTEKTKIKSASNCMTRKKPEETEKSKDDVSAVVTKRVTTRRAGHDKAIPTETTHTAATATPDAIHAPLPDPLPAATALAARSNHAPLDLVLTSPPLRSPCETVPSLPKETERAPSPYKSVGTRNPRSHCMTLAPHPECMNCRLCPSTGIRTTLNNNRIFICDICCWHRSGAHLYGYKDYDCCAQAIPFSSDREHA
ncbi:hypothetical protein M405DRAFT_863489 [Rhizopogon salebrosus TDB-379]|nr:hypothetical protein M405DRAFT_863489 [Rhizopogon salebrosus TDB-379]